jgi:hypothetical protein
MKKKFPDFIKNYPTEKPQNFVEKEKIKMMKSTIEKLF